MLLMLFSMNLILLILFMMLLMNLILSKKMNKNREKMSPFECGFDPMSNNRMPFSLQFYLITIIFLIFDVEISLILPMIYSNSFLSYMLNFSMIFILLILLFGLYLEIYEGAMKWFK